MSDLTVRTDDVLPPYDPDESCPKCAASSDQIWTTFKPRCGDPSCNWHAEHLARGCRRCRFEWPEAVVESQQGPGAQ